MIYVIISLTIIFIAFLIILSYYNQLNTIDNIKIKLDEATKNISIVHEKEITILTKISKDFQKQYNKKAIPNLSKIKNKGLNVFELEKELILLNKSLKEFIEDNNITDYEYMDELHTTLIELKSLKLFYNEYIQKYNNLITSLKYIFLRIIKKERKKELFEISKEIEFEILKKDK